MVLGWVAGGGTPPHQMPAPTAAPPAYGLAESLRAQGKASEAAAVGARSERAWAGADVQLTASRF
jgi:hypothetical protein